MKELKKVVGYIRVSSIDQREEGVSLDAQKAKIQMWAELNGYPVLSIFSDKGITGTRTKRPGLLKALDMACTNQSILVVYSLSRLSRSTTDTLKFASRLENANAELVSISEKIDTLSAAGKMIFRVLAVLNEFESDLGSERTKAALDYKREQGYKTGGYIPYGYKADNNNRLFPCPIEQGVLQTMLEYYNDGMSYGAIAKYLNTNNIATKQSKGWHPQSVKSIIQRERKALNLDLKQPEGPTTQTNELSER